MGREGPQALRTTFKPKPPLSADEKSILTHLFENGPNNLYRIEKALGLKHSTAHRILKGLEQKGYIQPVKSSVFKTGLRTNTWFLTGEGLGSVLIDLTGHFPPPKSDLDRIFNRLEQIKKAFPNLHPYLNYISVFSEGEIFPWLFLKSFLDCDLIHTILGLFEIVIASETPESTGFFSFYGERSNAIIYLIAYEEHITEKRGCKFVSKIMREVFEALKKAPEIRKEVQDEISLNLKGFEKGFQFYSELAKKMKRLEEKKSTEDS